MMKYMIGFVVLIFPFLVSAQTCNLQISGTIIDEHDGLPIPNAKIYIKGVSGFYTSDSLGRYQIMNLCPGKFQLIGQHHVGCEPVRIDIDLLESQVVNLSLEYHLLKIEETTVIHFVLDESVLSTVRLSDLDRLNSGGKTLGEQLKRLPGVQTLSTGNSISKPVIHGLHSNRILVMNNGVRQEGQQWGSEHAPEVDPFLSSEISVVKGASAVKFGPEAIGGVIQVNPSDWETEKPWKGEVFTGFYSNGRQGAISGKLENKSQRIDGLSFRAHGTFKKSGSISAPGYVLGNTGFEEYNFSVASRYKRKNHEFEVFYSEFNTQIGIFSGSHIGNLSDLKAAFAAPEPIVKSDFTYAIKPPKQRIEHGLLKLSWKTNWKKKHESELIYSRQSNDRLEFDIKNIFSNSEDPSKPDFRLLLITNNLDYTVKSKWSERLETQIGTQFSFQQNARDGRYLVPNFLKYMGGVFGVANYRINKWNMEAGVRYDYVLMDVFYFIQNELVKPRKTFQNGTATAGISHVFNHHWVVKANTSLAWRPPSISELYSDGLHHGAAAIEVGSDRLDKEQSVTGQLSAQYKSRRFSFAADFYHTAFQNFIYLRPVGIQLSINGAFPSFQYEQVRARFSGIDFSSDYSITKNLSHILKYSFVRAFNLTDKTFLVGIPADRLENGLAINWKWREKYDFRGIVGSTYLFRQSRFEENIEFVDPPTDYMLLNLELNMSFLLKNNEIQLALTVDNLLDKTYRDYMNRFRFFSDEMGRNIGIKLNYKF